MDKISIVIPVYNTEKYLPKCLESIISQSYENWECVLVNDGSSDKSGEICEAYAAKDSRFKTVHQENMGVSAARNQGIALCSGKFISFIDSDDYVAPTYLQVLHNGICTPNGVISVCQFFCDGGDTACLGEDEIISKNVVLLTLFGDHGIGGYIGGKMFLAEIIKEQGLQFDSRQTLAEDLIFVYQYLACCHEKAVVYFGKQPLYCYVKNENSALESRSYAKEFNPKWLTIIDAYDKICDGCKDEKIVRAAKNGKVMQCVTLLRIMARHGLRKDRRYLQLRGFVARELCRYMVDRNFSIKKRVGAAVVLVIPNL